MNDANFDLFNKLEAYTQNDYASLKRQCDKLLKNAQTAEQRGDHELVTVHANLGRGCPAVCRVMAWTR